MRPLFLIINKEKNMSLNIDSAPKIGIRKTNASDIKTPGIDTPKSQPLNEGASKLEEGLLRKTDSRGSVV